MVNTIPALGAFDNAGFPQGTNGRVIGPEGTQESDWKLVYGGNRTVDGINVIAASTGDAQWWRTPNTRPERTFVLEWFLAPITGDDENSGWSAATALRTASELSRRLRQVGPRELVIVNLLEDNLDPDDAIYLNNALETYGSIDAANGVFPNQNIVLRIIGQRTTQANLVLTDGPLGEPASTAPKILGTTAVGAQAFPAATIDVASTSEFPTAGQAVIQTVANGFQQFSYTGKTPTSFTGVTGGTGNIVNGAEVYTPLPAVIRVNGTDFTPYIGMQVELPNGAIGTIAMAPEPGVAWLQPFITLSAPTSISPTANPLTAAQYPTADAEIRIYTCTAWAPHFSPGDYQVEDAMVAWRDVNFTAAVATRQGSRVHALAFEGCIFNRLFFQAGYNGGAWMVFGGGIQLAPNPGRTATVLFATSGQIRFSSFSFINTDARPRENSLACMMLANCLFTGTEPASGGMFVMAGPGDAPRSGPKSDVFVGLGAVNGVPGGNFGTGFFRWPAAGTLPPVGTPGTASYGAAICMGHGGEGTCGSRIYGVNGNAGTYGLDVREGGAFLILNTLSNALPTADLRLSGALREILLDGQLTHVPDANYRAAVTAGVPLSAADLVTLERWADWQNAPFSRNAVGNLSTARILNIQQ